MEEDNESKRILMEKMDIDNELKWTMMLKKIDIDEEIKKTMILISKRAAQAKNPELLKPLVGQFKNLKMKEKIAVSEVFPHNGIVNELLWEISQFGIVQSGTYPEIPIDKYIRPLTYERVNVIFRNCGFFLPRLMIDLQIPNAKDDVQYYAIVDNVAYPLEEGISYPTLPVALQLCRNLTGLEIVASPGHENGRSIILTLIKVNRNLRKLRLKCFEILPQNVMRVDSKWARRLEKRLVLHGFQSNEALYMTLMSQQFNIEQMTLTNSNDKDLYHASNIIRSLPEFAEDIRVLELVFHHENLRILSLNDIEHISLLKNLRVLNITGGTAIFREVYIWFNIVTRCTKLEEVFFNGQSRMTKSCLNIIMSVLSSIKSVKIQGVNIDEERVKYDKWSIRHLAIINSTDFLNKLYHQFPDFEKLTLLSIRRCYINKDIMAKINNIQTLRKLEIKLYKNQGCATLTPVSLPNLEELSLNYDNLTRVFNEKVTINLQKLRLDDCFLLTEAELQKVSILHHLKEFQVTNCPQMTDSVIANVSRRCKKLETVHLEGCEQLTGASIRALWSISSLTHLKLMSLEIDSVEHEYIVDSNLKLFEVSDCPNIKMYDMEYCLAKMHRLSRLTFDGRLVAEFHSHFY